MNLFINHRTTFTNAREYELGQRPEALPMAAL